MPRLKHGHTSRSGMSLTYSSWLAMRARCYDKKHCGFHNYGGRGIRVCRRWYRDFREFLRDMGERPSRSHELDRIDNNRGYRPSNCRWTTHAKQASNRRTNRLLFYRGKIRTLTNWARFLGLNPSTLAVRHFRGVRGDALFRPAQVRGTWRLK